MKLSVRLPLLLAVFLGGAAPSDAFEFALQAGDKSLSDRLSEVSALAPLRDQQNLEAIDILAAARSDYRRLLSALYDEAYYGAAISIRIDGREASGISLLGVSENVGRVEISVTPGKRFTFSQAEIAPLASGTMPAEEFEPSQIAYAGIIREAAQGAIRDWRDVGHAKAEIAAQSVTANHRNAQLRVDIAVDPGPQLRFGALQVPQDDVVRPNRIMDIAGLPTGEVFSPQELDTAGQRLRQTGVFRSVVLSEAENANPDQTLDINADLVAAKPRRIGFGGEIGTVEGLSLSGFWLHRNLLGGAERLRFDAEIAGINEAGISGGGEGIDYSLSGRFDRPATFTPDTAFFVEAELARVDEPDYTENSARIESGLTHVFSEHLSGELGFAVQYSDVSDDLGDRELAYLQLPVGLTFDTRDDGLNPTSGLYADIDLMPFFETNNSTTGLRFFSDLRTYLTPGSGNRLTAALRLQIGSVAGGELADIAPDMLFFSGGAGTVRGQGYQSLAVDLGGGLTAGGRSFIGASAELRAKVTDVWSVVAFYDAGFIGEESFADANGDWHFGAGLGVRYNTGIGPIRLDLATPVGAGSGNNIEFYIGIGQAF